VSSETECEQLQLQGQSPHGSQVFSTLLTLDTGGNALPGTQKTRCVANIQHMKEKLKERMQQCQESRLHRLEPAYKYEHMPSKDSVGPHSLSCRVQPYAAPEEKLVKAGSSVGSVSSDVMHLLHRQVSIR